MTERKLTPEQIEDLFSFCEEQDVKYYDVQIELVDHLASAIEQKWIERPTLSYDKALWSVFNQFGLSGFRKVRRAKEKELRKKYTRVLGQYILKFFKLPRIVMIIALTLSLFGIFRVLGNHLETYVLLLASYILFLIVLLIVYKKKYQISLIKGKSFLLYDYLQSIRTSYYAAYQLPASVLAIYAIGIKNHDLFQFYNIYFELFVAFLVTIFSVFLVAISMYIPGESRRTSLMNFPNLFNHEYEKQQTNSGTN